MSGFAEATGIQSGLRRRSSSFASLSRPVWISTSDCELDNGRVDLAPGTVVPPLGVVSSDEMRGLYWATTTFAFPQTVERVILPREWVGASQLFCALPSDLDAEQITALAGRRSQFAAEPSLEKCVGEAVYEQVRQRVLPSAPSRLRCLFAALDMLAAIEFAQLYLPASAFEPEGGIGHHGAMPVSTADGKWVALDMHLFEVPTALGADSESNAESIESVEAQAERYWRGEQSSELFVEILAERLWQWTVFISEAGVPPGYAEWHASRGI